ncbi:uncharacterized protein G2W53_027126 [Senna tora]|uniref:Uncharacterized protein n=1 Tax=Senna tora TaxID=362788 RepID=A0A834TID4_9FABA|nr:uncharacterized protein G2W53_027126 [Senna tora]
MHVVDRRATHSNRHETSWEASLWNRDHFDSAYAREILHRKEVDLWVINFLASSSEDDPRRRPSKIWSRPSRIALKLLGRIPYVIGFILTQHMHVRFCIGKKLTHHSLIFERRQSTWSTGGRPTQIAMKLLGRLPCVVGIILTQDMHHMHVRFCIEKTLTDDSLIFERRRSTWSTTGRPTRIALKLLGRLPRVIEITLTQHLHVRF